jgi:beta-glucanase (GH16 family)
MRIEVVTETILDRQRYLFDRVTIDESKWYVSPNWQPRPRQCNRDCSGYTTRGCVVKDNITPTSPD